MFLVKFFISQNFAGGLKAFCILRWANRLFARFGDAHPAYIIRKNRPFCLLLGCGLHV